MCYGRKFLQDSITIHVAIGCVHLSLLSSHSGVYNRVLLVFSRKVSDCYGESESVCVCVCLGEREINLHLIQWRSQKFDKGGAAPGKLLEWKLHPLIRFTSLMLAI